MSSGIKEHEWDYRGQFSGGSFIYDCRSCGASVWVDRGKCESIQQAMGKAGIAMECSVPRSQAIPAESKETIKP